MSTHRYPFHPGLVITTILVLMKFLAM